MAVSISVRRRGRGAGCAAAVCLCLGLNGWTTVYAARVTTGSRRAMVLTPWESAEKGRELLEAVPAESRTHGDYERVREAYRAVYHNAPGDMHAAAAVNAVAELLAEEGRGAVAGSGGRSPGAAKMLKAAVGQYEYLRKQYPGSSLRVAALLAEAQIEENDLGDRAAARATYGELLTSYPRSSKAEEARAGLASLNGRGGVTAIGVGEAGSPTSGKNGSGLEVGAGEAGRSTSLRSGRDDKGLGEGSLGGGSAAASARNSLPAMAPTGGAAPAAPVANVRRMGALATVKGIRHWSTPNYTRVAIDLGDSVTYEAARVANPDRIYFDLHGTRLAGDLVGKSFGVTDDGFLKRIRAAQFSDDMTRVVLDVNDVTEYSAFLLPNPYRLIIDIHGGGRTGQPMAMMGAPAVAAPTVPNTTAVKGATPGELARVSEQPGKVEATREPTSKPIASVVWERQGTGSRGQGTAGGEQGAAAAAGAEGSAGSAARSVNESVSSAGAAAVASVPPTPVSSMAVPGRRGRKGKAMAADAKVVGDPATPARAAVPTADGETSLVRALGLKIGRIVIDAGHGGHDSGTLGVDGIEEKDVVLDVALRLGAMLKERLGAEVIYTRSDDTFIPLETRTAIANKAQADLFLSIHANSSEDASARGVETYYLNFTSQADALEVAARENAVSDQSIHQLSDLVKKIALKDKIAESREFASDVETSLYGGLQAGNAGLKDRGVKKAPFVVLIGANMPSILAEISFVTNPRDASQLRQGEYRQRVAQSLYKGVAKYAGGLSGTPRVQTARAGGN